MFGLAYIIVFQTEKAAYILEGMASLSTIWAVGLSVLGIYVYKRSEDKKVFSNVMRPEIPIPLRKPQSSRVVSRETKQEPYYNE
jgi:hypothetical protein